MWVSSVSNSRLNTYNECGWKYLLKYIYYIPEPDNGEGHAAFGSFIHKVFELGVNCKTFMELRKIADEARPNYSFPDAKFSNSLIDKCLTNFLRLNVQLYQTVAVELDEKVEIADTIISHVIIDRVVKGLNGEYLVIDYKTGRREKTKLQLLKDHQMRGYALAVSKIYNIPLDKITAMHFYPITGNIVSVKYMPWDYTSQIKYTKNLVWKIRKTKLTDFKPRKNAFCDYCGFSKNGMCPLFADPELVQLRVNEAKEVSKAEYEKSKSPADNGGV